MGNFHKTWFPLILTISLIIMYGTANGQFKTKDQTSRSGNNKLNETTSLNNKTGFYIQYEAKPVGSGKQLRPVNPDAVIHFSEDFDSIPGPTAGGAGTYLFPSGWNLVNNDGRTPAGGVGYVNEAWERREDFKFNAGDSAAFSTSWYTPAGQSDDWMISPAIIIEDDARLSWNAVAYDLSYPDGYEVRISITTQDIAGCLANPPLLSISAENSVWTERSLSLASAGYTNDTIYLAWRNNSNDKFLLLIDDILVEGGAEYDAEIENILLPSEYSMIPQSQRFPLQLGASVLNKGINDLTNVRLQAEIYQNGLLVHTGISSPVSTIAPDTSEQILVPSYIPADTGLIEIEYKVIINETDEDTTNNTGMTSVYISEKELARDDGIITGALGIGAGNGGEIGSQFTLNNTGLITGVRFYLSRNYLTEPVFANVRSFENGYPGNLIAVSDTFFAAGTDGQWITLNFSGGAVSLPPDTFVITVNEIDSTIQLGYSNNIITAGTNWVNWPTSPYGNWANIEDFGFTNRQFMVRPIIENPFIIVDGIKDSFYTTLTGPDDGYLQIRSYAYNDNGAPDDDGDLSAKVWAAWDYEWFYLYEEVKDDTVSANYGASWGVDMLELKFDPQPSDSLVNSIWHAHLTALAAGSPEVIYAEDMINIADSDKQLARRIIPGGYALELAIKWEAIGHNNPEVSESIIPDVDSIFGLAINQHDNDARTPPGRQASVQWAAVLLDAVYQTPKYCGTVKLLPGHKMEFTAANHMTGVVNPVPYDGSDPTGVNEDELSLPAEFGLSQNYPNPFNPETIIRFTIPGSSLVSLIVYDILGNEVSVLLNEQKEAGEYRIKFGGENISSGVYFYQLRAGSFVQTNKMILLK